MSGAVERVQSWSMLTDRLTFYLTLMRVQEAQGDLTGAYETLRLAKELKAAHPVFLDLARMVDLYEIRLALGLPVFAILAWVRGWWKISTRVYYTLN